MKRREFLKRTGAWLGAGAAASILPLTKARAAGVLFADTFARRGTSKGWGKPWFNQRYGMAWGIAQKKGFYDVPAPLPSASAFSPNPLLVLDQAVADVDLTATFSTDNANGRFGLLARATGYAGYYVAYLSGDQIRLSRFDNSRELELKAISIGSTILPGDSYNLRLKVSGFDPAVQLRAKIWRAGAHEPPSWAIKGVDTDADRIRRSGAFGAFFSHDAVTLGASRFRISKFKASSTKRPLALKPHAAFAFAGRVIQEPNGFRARVVAKSDIPSTLVFRHSTDPTMKHATKVPADEKFVKPGVSKAWLSELPADTTIYWDVVASTKKRSLRSETRSFRTPSTGGNRASFAFGSCSHFFPVSRSFEEIAKLGPDFFAHLGDFGYPDDLDGSVMQRRSDTYQDRWTRMLARPPVQHLHQRSLWIGIQDDHDYGINNAWSQTVHPFTLDAFDQISGNLNERHFDLRFGDLHAFFVDCHVNSDDPAAPDSPSHSILGASQKQWLKDSMNDSDAALLVLLTSLPFWGSGPGDATWKSAFGNERLELMGFFANQQGPGRRVLICSGNSHAQYVNRHADPSGKDVFEFVSSGTDRIDTSGSKPVPIRDQVVDPQRSIKSVDAFGYVSLDPPGPGRQVTLRSIDSKSGQNIWSPLSLNM
jgi:hypothetical protein